MFGKKHLARIAQLEKSLLQATAVRSALDQSTAIIELTPDGGILDANPNFCQAVGYSLGELRGMRHTELCEAADTTTRAYQEFWTRLRNGEHFQGRIQRKRKDGSTLWLEATYNPVRGEDGKVERVIKFAVDITQKVEEAARTAAMLEAIERSMAVIEFDVDGRVLRANDKFLSTMGYRMADVQGKHHRLFCAPELTGSPAYQAFWERLGRGEYASGQYPRINRQGREVWLEATYNPVFSPDGKVCKIVKFATDITASVERHRNQKAGADAAYEVALETRQISEEGERIILETVERMRSIAGDVEKAAGQVSTLGDKSQQITSIVNTIREIADQTNLLALNAAIEAARAGESGRGFAVVADEVRKLAERTSHSTTEISRMILGIQDETSAVTASMKQGLDTVAAGVDLANRAGQSIQQIRNDAMRVVEVIENLSRQVSADSPI